MTRVTSPIRAAGPTAGPTRVRRPEASDVAPRPVAMLWASLVVSLGIAAASAYGLMAPDPYRDLPEATVLAARGQDVGGILVAALLIGLSHSQTLRPRQFLLWLGLQAYVVYTYAIYLIGVPMNRVFLVYVVLVSVAGAALLSGLWRVTTMAWPEVGATRLRRGTGAMLVVVALLFAGLWLTTLLPVALTGSVPDPEGVGGAPYPVFVLDLVVVLPCVAAVGVLLLRGHRLGAPLALVTLIKILTLFATLWAGPAYALATDGPVDLGPDAGPSLLLLIASAWLVAAWWRVLSPTNNNERDGARR